MKFYRAVEKTLDNLYINERDDIESQLNLNKLFVIAHRWQSLGDALGDLVKGKENKQIALYSEDTGSSSREVNREGSSRRFCRS